MYVNYSLINSNFTNECSWRCCVHGELHIDVLHQENRQCDFPAPTCMSICDLSSIRHSDLPAQEGSGFRREKGRRDKAAGQLCGQKRGLGQVQWFIPKAAPSFPQLIICLLIHELWFLWPCFLTIPASEGRRVLRAGEDDNQRSRVGWGVAEEEFLLGNSQVISKLPLLTVASWPSLWCPQETCHSHSQF